MEQIKRTRSFRIIMIAALIFFLCGCSKRHLDPSQYGVRYIIDNSPDDQWLTLKLDPENRDIIRSLICVSADSGSGMDEETIRRLNTGTLQDDKNTTPVITDLHFNEEGKLIWYVLINFDRIDIETISELIDHLGLTNELLDGSLTYSELTGSDSFRFQDFFTKGRFENNISLNGDPRYDVDID